MIRNTVFDFGRVLVHFDEEYITSAVIPDPEDVRLCAPLLFDRKYWDRLDDGTLSEAQVADEVCPLLPERLRDPARQVLTGWYRYLPEINGMRALLSDLRRNGVPVYVLSNISKTFAAHADEIPILSLADGCVFSAECGAVKPSAEIFAHLCDRFSLSPDETVFIDDSPKNIAGAAVFGLHTYLFDGDSERLRETLTRKLGIPL